MSAVDTFRGPDQRQIFFKTEIPANVLPGWKFY